MGWAKKAVGPNPPSRIAAPPEGRRQPINVIFAPVQVGDPEVLTDLAVDPKRHTPEHRHRLDARLDDLVRKGLCIRTATTSGVCRCLARRRRIRDHHPRRVGQRHEALVGQRLLALAREVQPVAAGVEYDVVRGCVRLRTQPFDDVVEVERLVPEVRVVGVCDIVLREELTRGLSDIGLERGDINETADLRIGAGN
jgi:hypothetical protein